MKEIPSHERIVLIHAIMHDLIREVHELYGHVAQCFQIDENGKNSCLTRELDTSTSKLLEKLLIAIFF